MRAGSAPPFLALDTSGDLGSVAVSVGGEVVGRAFLPDRRRQAAELVPALDRAMAEAGIQRRDLAGIDETVLWGS